MIQIVQSEDFELLANGIDPGRGNIKRDVHLYAKFIAIYEKNFDIWLNKTLSIEGVKSFKESQVRYQSDPAVQERMRLRKEFDKVRPYIYFYEENFYFFKSTLQGLNEAVIILFEQEDICLILEKNLNNSFFFSMRMKKAQEFGFVTNLASL